MLDIATNKILGRVL